MHHTKNIEHASVIDHLERAVEVRKALLRAGQVTGNGSTGIGSNGVTTVPRRAASAAPKIQERALVQMQAMISEVERGAEGGGPLTELPELAELRKAVHDSCALIREDLSRLTDDMSRLVKASQRHGRRSNGAAAPAAVPQLKVVEEIGMNEPQFVPNGRAVRVAIEAVPDFDRATAVQQALSDLPQASSVAVIEFEKTSASIEMELAAPVSVREIMEQLREHTGRHYLVEQARPEEHNLRIRFIEHEEDRMQAGLKPELWPKA